MLPFVIALLVAACQTIQPSLAPISSPTGVSPGTVPSTSRPPATATPLPPIAEHWIGIRTVDGRGEFFDRRSNQRFVPRGANYLRLERNAAGAVVDRLFADYDPIGVEADLAAMRALGYTAVRIALENPRGLHRQPCRRPPVRVPHQHGRLPPPGPGRRPAGVPAVERPPRGGRFRAPGRGDVLRDVRRLHRDYWTAALEGLRAAGAPLEAIFAYDLRGELFVSTDTPPLSLRTGTITAANGTSYDLADDAARAQLVEDGIVHWVDEMAEAIRSVDPGVLVAVGEFAPNAPNVWRGEDPRAPPTIATFQKTTVDFIDVHPYPGYIPLDGLLQNMGVTGEESIPIVIGEYGAFTFAYPDPASGAAGVMHWQADSCEFGIDGWFHWHWRGSGDAEVWTGTEADGAINTVLSPRERRDPCATRGFPFLHENVAAGARVRASASAAGQGPERAVDGVAGSGWVAGDGPPQWIEVDFGGPATIETLRLVVDQSPAGRTVHVVSGGPSRDRLERLHVFDGSTTYGDELTWTPTAPLTGIRVLRIETTTSPSWVAWQEIEAIGRRD